MPALGMKHISRLKVCYGLKKKVILKEGETLPLYRVEKKIQNF